jgi:hypothetical protein
MAHSHSACPVCSNIIQDLTKEDCDQCGWILETENLLTLKVYDSLLEWAIRYYERVKELEGRSKYRQDLLNKRLDRHNDNIDLLQRQMKSIFAHFSEINSTLPSKEKSIDFSGYISVDILGSLENLNTAETEESETGHIDQQELTISQPEENNSTIFELPKPHQEIISDYYHNPREFTTKYQVKVANITKDSINANRGNEEKNVILEETNRGNYWIFSFGDDNYLVPVEDKYINQHSYTTTSTIFEGHNYTPDYQKIQLIKPAIVLIDPNTNPQTWRLQQQGELAFL